MIGLDGKKRWFVSLNGVWVEWMKANNVSKGGIIVRKVSNEFDRNSKLRVHSFIQYTRVRRAATPRRAMSTRHRATRRG